ncbi:hypothetical protein OAK47_01135 [Planctomycetaceae bacterium]|jgi:hypothetical protein|nr:hypothetical protein [Planctomycetaceae bacterium]MDG2389824.1 hypothetical protein [Planctomycetaceae bacterium]
MPAFVIPCPYCGTELKLKDRSLIGKKGKCPKCSKAFRLEEPEEEDEVQLELVAPSPAGNQSATKTAPVQQAPQINTFEAPVVAPDIESGGVQRMKEMRRKNKKRRNFQIVIGGLVAVLLAGTIYYIKDQPEKQALAAAEAKKPKRNAAHDAQKAKDKSDLEALANAAPTRGEPIALNFMPSGARVIINLHPDEFWKPGSLAEEFRYCIGPLGIWLETEIKALTKFDPSEIDRLRICLIPGLRNERPKVAAYVELKEEQLESTLIKLFPGDSVNDYEPKIYLTGDDCFIHIDNRRFAVGPGEYAQEMADAIDVNAVTNRDIETMLLKTDSERHLTILFDPKILRLEQVSWFPENARPVLNHFLDWLGDDVLTAIWSVHLDDQFHHEMLLRNDAAALPATVQRKLSQRLEEMPERVLSAVRKMTPQQIGPRKIIGRYPAMAKVFTMATSSGSDDRSVQFTTVLNDRAAPNLALGTLMAWDESTRTDFNKSDSPAAMVASNQPKKELTFEEKLQKQIEIDFGRMPLQDAFAYIADEAVLSLEIEGDALKLAGFTKNMPQTFKYEQISVTKAILAIINGEGNSIIKDSITKGTGKIGLFLDDTGKGFIIATEKYIADQGKTAYQLK